LAAHALGAQADRNAARAISSSRRQTHREARFVHARDII
jgi:hypothetical protein